jgi:hypothetical protein
MSFDDREKAFENKYKHDEELKFKVEVRLAKLFGQWVAAEIAMTPDKADAYAKEMVAAQLDAPGNDDIIDKAAADLKAAGKEMPRAALQAKVDALEPVARDQVMTETK